MRGPGKNFQANGLGFALVILLLVNLSSCGVGRAVEDWFDVIQTTSESRLTTLASETVAPNITQSHVTSTQETEVSTSTPTTASQTPAVTTTASEPSPAARAFMDSSAYLSGQKFDEALTYFQEIAAFSEFKGAKPITKWTKDVRIQVHGELTDSDRATLNDLLTFYNQIDGMPRLDLVESQPNVNLYFVPSKEMKQYIQDYVQGNLGFFEVFWNGGFEIYAATITISSDRTGLLDRNHLIWEELSQCLGLMNDSYQYQNSIFQQDYSVVQHPSALDFALMRMLYNPVVSAGDRGDRAVQALRQQLN